MPSLEIRKKKKIGNHLRDNCLNFMDGKIHRNCPKGFLDFLKEHGGDYVREESRKKNQNRTGRWKPINFKQLLNIFLQKGDNVLTL